MSTLVIATKYFGCQIEVNGNIHTMWGIVPDGVWYTENRTNKVAKWGEWKPMLKPLSEITDEDAIEVAKLATHRNLPHYTTDDFDISRLDKSINIRFLDKIYEVLNMDWDCNCLVYNDENNPFIEQRHWNQVTIIDFLRSRYYDIDNVLKPQTNDTKTD